MSHRILVTGPRDCDNPEIVHDVLMQAVGCYDGPVTIVHGACPTGVDAIAHEWATTWAQSMGLSVEAHPAQKHPTQDFGPWPGAGPRRNLYMTELGADLCVAFIAPCTRPNCRKPRPHNSHGTDSCVTLAGRAGINVLKVPL